MLSLMTAFKLRANFFPQTLDTPSMTSLTPGGFSGPRYELPSVGREIAKPPVELDVDEITPVKMSREKC